MFAALIALAFAADAPHKHGADDAAAAAKEKHNLDEKAPKPKGKMIDLEIKGGKSKAYLAKPEGAAKAGILVLHEWWGLNDWIKHQADVLAEAGYLALAVDLYDGKVAADPKTAQELMGKLDEKRGDQIEEAATAWLKKETGKKVATIGWCMGGRQSLNASLNDPKAVSATVIYYGMPIAEVAKLKTLKGPVLGIWAKKDGWITMDKVEAFDKALTEAGIAHEFHAYDAEHAFANPSNGPKYSGKDAKDAWEKTMAFLKKNLE